MNKSKDENRSVRNTKRKISEAFFQLLERKPLNTITIRELTGLADINRGTFYFHYSDIYDLMQKIEDEYFEIMENIFADIQDIPKQADSMEEALRKVHPVIERGMTVLWENRRYYVILTGKNGDINFLHRVKAILEEQLALIWNNLGEIWGMKEFFLYSKFLIDGNIGFINRWLLSGGEWSPGEISSHILSISGNVLNALYFAGKEHHDIVVIK